MQKHRFEFMTFLLISILITLSSCQTTPIKVSDSWARPGLTGDNSAAYFIVHNTSLSGDRLLKADSDVAMAVELHRSMVTNADSGGQQQMQMVPQEYVKIPLLRKTEFKPGGLHVMLIGLQRDLQPGDTFSLTLHFEKAGEIELSVPVREP